MHRFQRCVLTGLFALLLMSGIGLVSAQAPDLPPLMFLTIAFDSGKVEIHRLNMLSKRVLRLMPIPIQYYTQGAQWSADGAWITFTANRPDVDAPDVWIMDAGGGQARTLVKESRNYSWAPDSQHIVYDGLTEYGTSAIYTMALDGNDARLLEENADLPVWSPDGTQIAYRNHDVVSVINADGTGTKRLFERTDDMIGTLEWIAWSPDGTRIAFLISGERPEDNLPVSTLYTIAPDGTGLTRLTDKIHNPGTFYQWKPYDWSPDGRQIAFISNWYDAGLYTVNADGTDEQIVVQGYFYEATSEQFGEFQSADWSPDGQWIAFSASRYQGTSLWMVQPDGTNVRQLTRGDGNILYIFPEWRPETP